MLHVLGSRSYIQQYLHTKSGNVATRIDMTNRDGYFVIVKEENIAPDRVADSRFHIVDSPEGRRLCVLLSSRTLSGHVYPRSVLFVTFRTAVTINAHSIKCSFHNTHEYYIRFVYN